MFHEILPAVRERLRSLEEIDLRDRSDGTPKSQRLRQIPPETGKLLALLAACVPQGKVLEIGTSGGLFVADNASSHAVELAAFLERALADPRVEALVDPTGKGLLICRKA